MRDAVDDNKAQGPSEALQKDLLRITGDKYEPYQAYPREIFDVPGFRDWVDSGYYKYVANMKKTPYKVLR